MQARRRETGCRKASLLLHSTQLQHGATAISLQFQGESKADSNSHHTPSHNVKLCKVCHAPLSQGNCKGLLPALTAPALVDSEPFGLGFEGTLTGSPWLALAVGLEGFLTMRDSAGAMLRASRGEDVSDDC